MNSLLRSSRGVQQDRIVRHSVSIDLQLEGQRLVVREIVEMSEPALLFRCEWRMQVGLEKVILVSPKSLQSPIHFSSLFHEVWPKILVAESNSGVGRRIPTPLDWVVAHPQRQRPPDD